MRSISLVSCLLIAMHPVVTHAAVSFESVALSGDAAPGLVAGVTFDSFGNPFLNDIGEASFAANLAGAGVVSTNQIGIFSEAGGALDLVARTGDPAPGTPSGVTLSSMSNPQSNNSGQTAFTSSLTGTGVNSTNSQALYLMSGGTVDLFVRGGEPAVGAPAGVVHSGFLNNIAINDGGQITFGSFLSGPGVNDFDDVGIYVYSGGAFNLIARAGVSAPGTGAGVNFAGLYYAPRLNSAGQTAFLGGLSGTGVDGSNNSAIFSEAGGSLGLVARSGDPAPGTSAGVTFSNFEIPEFNDAGDTAFFAYLNGPGASHGIFVESGGTVGRSCLPGTPRPASGRG